MLDFGFFISFTLVFDSDDMDEESFAIGIGFDKLHLYNALLPNYIIVFVFFYAIMIDDSPERGRSHIKSNGARRDIAGTIVIRLLS